MPSLETSEERLRNSVVKILKADGTVNGTGFLVTSSACLTCYHVIRDVAAQNPSIGVNVEYRGHRLKAYYRETRSNAVKDVAVLDILDTKLPNVELFALERKCKIVDKEVRAYGYRKGFSEGYTATGTLRPGENLPEERGYVYNLETNMPDKTSLAGMSGCPVFDSQGEKIVGILMGEETAGPAISYVIPIETVYERWPELQPSQPSWSSTWLSIFLFFITVPFGFNIWLHSAFGIKREFLFLMAIPLFITLVWVILREAGQQFLGNLIFSQWFAKIQRFLSVYAIGLSLVSIFGFVDGLPAISVNRPIFKTIFDWGYPIAYRLSRYANFAFTIPFRSSPREKWIPEMVYIPAGSFQRGLSEERVEELKKLIRSYVPSERIDSKALDNELFTEKSGELVWLNDYYIGKYEVTNAQYYKFVEKYPDQAPEAWKGYEEWEDVKWKGNRVPEYLQKRPVLVTWTQAYEYCKWLSKETGEKYRLPTEAEWEKAARSTDGRLFPWGNEWDEDRANFNSKNLVEVDKYPTGASRYGCMNMAGNVPEWCLDWYAAEYYQKSSRTNPKGPSPTEAKVFRGGYYTSGGLHSVRSTRRGMINQKTPFMDCGFRVAKSFSKF